MKTHIFAYGGSIIHTSQGYDNEAIEEINKIIKKFPDDVFVFVIGGGHLARQMKEESESPLSTDEERDLVGINATRINAEHVKNMIMQTNDSVYEEVLTSPEEELDDNYRIFFSGGWAPGNSTDYVAIKFAEENNIDKVYKITEINHILNVKPEDYKKENVEKYEVLTNVTWDKLIDLVGNEWIPGLKTPLDPAAAKLGKKLSEKKSFTLYLGEKEDIESMLKGKYKGLKIE